MQGSRLPEALWSRGPLDITVSKAPALLRAPRIGWAGSPGCASPRPTPCGRAPPSRPPAAPARTTFRPQERGAPQPKPRPALSARPGKGSEPVKNLFSCSLAGFITLVHGARDTKGSLFLNSANNRARSRSCFLFLRSRSRWSSSRVRGSGRRLCSADKDRKSSQGLSQVGGVSTSLGRFQGRWAKPSRTT